MRSIIPVIISVMFASCAGNSNPDKNKKLAGMYKLSMAENADSGGIWKKNPWTKGGTGYIVYYGMGHMAVHITR